MYGAGWNTGAAVLWPLHILSGIALTVGVFLLLFWAFKNLSEKRLQQWGWTLVILGALGCLATMSMLGSAWNRNFAGGFGASPVLPMMGNWQNASQSSQSTSQQAEEAEGKSLYGQLQAKQKTCADLSENDFELIGEYVMGQRAGASHEQMNTMMQQMMGQKGEEQMHIILGRNATGCVAR